MGKRQGNEFEVVKRKVSDWLLKDGFQVTEAIPDDAEWGLAADSGNGLKVVVGQKTGRPDVLVVGGDLRLDDLAQNELDKLSSYDDLLWDLRFRLLETGLDFGGLERPLQRIFVSEHVYVEDLNKTGLSRTVRHVRSGLLAALWTIQRVLHRPVPGEANLQAAVN